MFWIMASDSQSPLSPLLNRSNTEPYISPSSSPISDSSELEGNQQSSLTSRTVMTQDTQQGQQTYYNNIALNNDQQPSYHAMSKGKYCLIACGALCLGGCFVESLY